MFYKRYVESKKTTNSYNIVESTSFSKLVSAAYASSDPEIYEVFSKQKDNR